MSATELTRRFQRLQRLAEGPYVAFTIRFGRKLLRDFPDFGPAWMLVGKALVESARYEEAEQAFAKALDRCPAEKRHHILAQMGHLHCEAGELDRAVEWYEQAIVAAPNDASPRIYLGCVKAKQGRLIEAEESHRRATQCAAGCIDEAWLNLGMVLRAREQFFEAAECFREALRLDPNYGKAKRCLRDVELCLSE